MNKEKYVFAQLVSFLDKDKFRHIVNKYQGNRYVKHFTCWNQLLALMFGQLCNREILRDLIVALDAHRSKCYHLGMGKNVSKSSLARANQDRDYRIFEEFAYQLVTKARETKNRYFQSWGQCLRFRFNHNRPLFIGLLVGKVSQGKRRCQGAYFVRCGDTDTCILSHHKCFGSQLKSYEQNSL